MASEGKRIFIDPDGELARLLDDATRAPLLVEKGGVTFRITVEPPSRGAAYDPRAAIVAMRAAAGRWRDIDAEAFKAHLYRAREEGTKRETSA